MPAQRELAASGEEIRIARLRLQDDSLLQIAGGKGTRTGRDVRGRAARDGQHLGPEFLVLVKVIAAER